MDGFDSLGAEDSELGFDYGGLLQAAGGVASYGISAAETEKKESADKADQDKKLKASIAADVAAANAVGKAAVSSQLKSPSAAMDSTAADMAVADADRAGSAGLSAESAQKRADAADAALKAAVANAQKKPGDGFAAAMVAAWKQTANKAHSTAIVSTGSGAGGKGGSVGGQSWWTRPVVGPLPGVAVVVGGVGIVGAVGLLLKKFVFGRSAA